MSVPATPAPTITGDTARRMILAGKSLKGMSVSGNLSLSYCTGLTSVDLPETVGGNLSLSGCTGLTSVDLPETVVGYLYLGGCTGLTSIDLPETVVGHLYLGGCTAEVRLHGKPINYRTVDGYSMLIRSTRVKNGITIHRAAWLRRIAPGKPLDACYIAEQGEYTAHGETVAEAISDLRFKIAQVDFDADELVAEIKRRGTVRREDFRLITGACDAGLSEGLREAGLDPDALELPLSVVLEKAHGSFGDAFRRYFA